jgi:hypothetical protein
MFAVAPKLLRALLLQLALLSARPPSLVAALRPNDPAGEPSCRCIDPAAAGARYTGRCDPTHRALPGGGCSPGR